MVVLRRSVMGALCALALAGCAGESSDGSADGSFCAEVRPRVEAYLEQARAEHATPEDERYGGTVVVATIGELRDGMNAFVSADRNASQHQQFVNLMTLIHFDESLSPRPYLAESWEVDDEISEITFHLRDDVSWHDGHPFDAGDVAFTFITITDPRTAFPNPAFFDHYVRGPEGVEVVDEHTVKVRLRPHAEFLDVWRAVPVLPEHLLGDVPPEELRAHPYGTECPVGNGPFVFREHQPQERWVFDANPAFPEELGGRPYIDSYVYRPISEQATLLTELLTENIDIFLSPRPDQVQRILDHPRLDLTSFTSRNYVFVAWNARRPQLSDARVRRALTLGTNRQEIAEALLRGYGRVANASVPPFHWAYDPSMGEAVPFDPAAARALLEEAGWADRDGDGVRENGDGLELAIVLKYNQGSQSRRDIAEIMQAQLAEVGVRVQPESVEFGTLIDQLNDAEVRGFDGVVMAWATEFRLDDTDLFHSERIDQPLAWSGTRNQRIDALLEALATTVDRAEALPLWREYQKVLSEEQPYTFFFFTERLQGVNKRVRNVRMDARGELAGIGDWWIDPAQR